MDQPNHVRGGNAALERLRLWHGVGDITSLSHREPRWVVLVKKAQVVRRCVNVKNRHRDVRVFPFACVNGFKHARWCGGLADASVWIGFKLLSKLCLWIG